MSYDFPQPRPRPRSGARSTERGSIAPAPTRAVPLAQGDPRSAGYLEALRELDHDTGHDTCHDTGLDTCPDLRSATAAIRAEFAGNPAEPAPALIAKCWLGDHTDVHTVDPDRETVTHHRKDEALPPELERVRAAVVRGDFAAVELHHDRLVYVLGDGNTKDTGREE